MVFCQRCIAIRDVVRRLVTGRHKWRAMHDLPPLNPVLGPGVDSEMIVRVEETGVKDDVGVGRSTHVGWERARGVPIDEKGQRLFDKSIASKETGAVFLVALSRVIRGPNPNV